MGPDRAAALARERAGTLDRAAALTRQIDALAEQQALTTHDDEHDPEGVTIGYERAQLQGLLAGTRAEVAALDRAVARMAGGTYGRCTSCGADISAARLDALPAADTCIVCARRPPGTRGASRPH